MKAIEPAVNLSDVREMQEFNDFDALHPVLVFIGRTRVKPEKCKDFSVFFSI